MNYQIDSASFRDKDATIVYFQNKVYRLIFDSYKSNYDLFLSSGLYKNLLTENKIVSHLEIDNFQFINKQIDYKTVYKVLEVDKIPFITYPYEWSFEHLKQAALLTLEIQKKSLEYGLTLKDASAYNVQFIGNRPIFIDTSSFEIYNEGSPWVAYRQFCMHFLAPLLMHYYKIPQALKFSQLDINGVSLDFASKVLPFKSKLNLSVLMHIHLHAKSEIKNKQIGNKELPAIHVSKSKLINIIDHLFETISNLRVHTRTEWTDYYNTFSYSEISFKIKKEIIEKWLAISEIENIVDAGCNEGEFSFIASKFAKNVISFDFDESVIRNLFFRTQKQKIDNIYSLVVDLSSPSPSIGWNNKERKSLLERLGKNNTTMALALVHHLSIGNNVPFIKQAEFFASFSKSLIIEFVPKNDVQVSRLLVSRKDIFSDYNLDNFINAFSNFFILENQAKIKDTERILLYFKRK